MFGGSLLLSLLFVGSVIAQFVPNVPQQQFIRQIQPPAGGAPDFPFQNIGSYTEYEGNLMGGSERMGN
ncbi:unnamed protein product [Heligmosomoides polygyrus]|uniref:Uncharacterized protein n=1 Tax=Heligmosomoides polygyrus TaxID=6339 RepID=A0A183F521_HELPZ|nr:unnamed protein product [Heligmosomoides polygyrus]